MDWAPYANAERYWVIGSVEGIFRLGPTGRSHNRDEFTMGPPHTHKPTHPQGRQKFYVRLLFLARLLDGRPIKSEIPFDHTRRAQF